MNKRVFQVDQECFLIYAEELSHKKERFLRIGNSPFLKEVEKDLTFITLLSEILPGDPLKEIEIFKKDKCCRVTGLKKTVDRFIEFLKKNEINTKNVKTVIAEKEKDLTSEKDFINRIRENNSIKNHSFASFYGGGNIKIFNKSETIFDLLEGLGNTTDINNEICLASDFFKSGYISSYKKNGIIHSGRSFFVFSNNQFIGITGSKTWVKDAIRVGISPDNIELLYISKNTSIDDIFIKTLIAKSLDKKITILSNEKPLWFPLVQGKNVKYFDPVKDKTNYKIGDINITFSKDQIKIFYKNMSLKLDDEEPFLEKSSEINIEFQAKSEKLKSKVIIEDYNKESLTLYEFNPLIFEDSINETDYVKNFWKNFPDEIKSEDFREIIKDDNEYIDYSPHLKNKSFYSKLFTETVRRINHENNQKMDDLLLDTYKNLLTKFSGDIINENNIIIEQTLGYDINNNKISIRDMLANKNFIYLNSEVNPFLKFKNDETREKWEAKLKKYRESYKKNVNDDKKEKAIREKFTETLESKRFYVEEQNRLKRFIAELIIKERQEENQKKRKEETKISGSIKENKIFDNKQEEAVKASIQHEDKNKKFFSFLRSKNKGKNIKIPILIFIIILLLLIGLFLMSNFKPARSFVKKYIPDKILGIKENKKPEMETKGKESYKVINNYNDRKIIEINIEITVIDVLNFTNLVAEKNGYHKIVDEREKALIIAGNDPDWIYPDFILILPDETKIVIKENDNMWNLSEDFLTKEAKAHEVMINEILFNIREKKINLNNAKEKLEMIKSESHLNNLKNAIDDLLKMDDLANIKTSM